MTDIESSDNGAPNGVSEATALLDPASTEQAPDAAAASSSSAIEGEDSASRTWPWKRGTHPARTAPKGFTRTILEWAVLILLALAIAFVIKSTLFQAFFIPSESMTPTLRVGDRVLVNKLSYDLHDVNRGDIIVFEAPPAARSADIEDLVKRAIGLPGDTITGDQDGHVLVNGRRLKEPYLPAGTFSRFTDVAPGCGIPADGGAGCVVPSGHVFMMGDNREASKDSRVFGPINEDTIIGRVFVRICRCRAWVCSRDAARSPGRVAATPTIA